MLTENIAAALKNSTPEELEKAVLGAGWIIREENGCKIYHPPFNHEKGYEAVQAAFTVQALHMVGLSNYDGGRCNCDLITHTVPANNLAPLLSKAS